MTVEAAEIVTETASTPTIAERVARKREADRLSAWSDLAGVFRNKGKRSSDENTAKLAAIASELEIPIAELDSLKRIVTEFDHLDGCDEQAITAAAALEQANTQLADFDSETDIIITPLRQALASAEQERAAGRTPLASAATTAQASVKAAQQKQARRDELAGSHVDLLGTHAFKAGQDAAIAEAHAERRRQEREAAECGAIDDAVKNGRLTDMLPEPARSRIADEVARTGRLHRFTVVPDWSHPDYDKGNVEIGISFCASHMSTSIEQEIKDRREQILAQLLRGEINRKEAGAAVIRWGEHRGQLRKSSYRHDDNTGQFSGGAA